jgi:hypothetical protein
MLTKLDLLSYIGGMTGTLLSVGILCRFLANKKISSNLRKKILLNRNSNKAYKYK